MTKPVGENPKHRHSITAKEAHYGFKLKYNIPDNITKESAKECLHKILDVSMKASEKAKMTQDTFINAETVIKNINDMIQLKRSKDDVSRVQPAFKVPTVHSSLLQAFRVGSGREAVKHNMELLRDLTLE